MYFGVRFVSSVKKSLRSSVVIVFKISGPVSWYLLCCFAQLTFLRRTFARKSLRVKAGAILTPATFSHERTNSESHGFGLLALSFAVYSIFQGQIYQWDGSHACVVHTPIDHCECSSDFQVSILILNSSLRDGSTN